MPPLSFHLSVFELNSHEYVNRGISGLEYIVTDFFVVAVFFFFFYAPMWHTIIGLEFYLYPSFRSPFERFKKQFSRTRGASW